jgi:hypothetical protein
MQTLARMETTSTAMARTGYLLSGIAVLFLLFDTVIKLTGIQPVRDSMVQLGYPVELATTIGVIELLCLFVYIVPRTSILGAVLLTGFLGGAIATHLRIGSPLASHTLFPIYVAVLVWGGLYLRDVRLRAFVWQRD